MPQFDRLKNIRKVVVPSIELQTVPKSVKDKAVTTAGQARGLWGKAVSLSKDKASTCSMWMWQGIRNRLVFRMILKEDIQRHACHQIQG